jgi:hypothetical protein
VAPATPAPYGGPGRADERTTHVRPFRILAAVGATALLVAACGGGSDETAGSGSAATDSTASATASPTPSGNGVADLSTDQILAKSKAALQAADSVRIAGSGGSGGEKIKLDIKYAKDTSQGTITVSGQPVEIRRIGGTAYIKGSEKFLGAQVPAEAAKLLTGKWLKVPVTDSRFGDLTQLFDLSKAADGILTPDGTVTKGEAGTIDGKPAIALKSGKDGGALWIATTGQPYPLQIVSTGTDSGKIDFTDYGATVAVEAPPAAQVVDVSKLGN